jgi:hypothetical protein
MTYLTRGLFAVTISIMFAGPSWGQGLIPVRVPLRIPVAPVHSFYRQSGNQSDSDSGNPEVLLWIFGGMMVLGAVSLVIKASMDRTVAHLRIVRTPPGEAPEAIRQAWIGVELPLRSGETKPHNHPMVGVLSLRSSGRATAYGYSVNGRLALEALASHSPTAAEWWRKHVPQVLDRGYQLWFPPEVCELVNGARG